MSIAQYFIILVSELERTSGKQIIGFWFSCIIRMNICNELK